MSNSGYEIQTGNLISGHLETSATDETVSSFEMPNSTDMIIDTTCVIQNVNTIEDGYSYKITSLIKKDNDDGYFEILSSTIREIVGNETDLLLDIELDGYDVVIKTTGTGGTTYSTAAFSKIKQITNVGINNVLSNYSTTFNGVDEYITMDSVYNFEMVQPLSLSIWVKTTLNSISHVIGRVSSSTTQAGYALLIDSSGKPFFELVYRKSTSDYLSVGTTSATVNDGDWHHIVVTYDGSIDAGGVKFYIDSVDIVALTINQNSIITTDIFDAGEFTIGRRYSSSLEYPYNGKLDEASIWSKELSISDVDDIYNSGSPNNLTTLTMSDYLIGWWRLGDNDTYPAITDNRILNSEFNNIFPTIEDQSINNNDGTMLTMTYNDILLESPGGTGSYSDFSLEFDGSTDNVNMGDILNFNNATNDAFSISSWIKVNLTDSGDIIRKDDGTGYRLTVTSDGNIQFYLINITIFGIKIVTNSTDVHDGYWHHVVVTHDGTQSASGTLIYVDNTSRTFTTSQDNLGTKSTISSEPLKINSGNLRANITDASIYNRKLTVSEISEIYNSGSPTNLRFLDSSSNLVGWWRLGSQLRLDGSMINMGPENITSDAP